MSNFWESLINVGKAVNNAAYQSQQNKGQSKGQKKADDCTPCAAQAYVDSLRPTPDR